MVIATAIIAIGVSVAFIFTANEAHVTAESIMPSANQEQLSDMCSGFYNASNMMGELMGPLIGGILFQYVGFKKLCLIIGLLGIFISLVYLTLGQAYTLFTTTNTSKANDSIQFQVLCDEEFKEGEAKINQKMENLQTDDTDSPNKKPTAFKSVRNNPENEIVVLGKNVNIDLNPLGTSAVKQSQSTSRYIN